MSKSAMLRLLDLAKGFGNDLVSNTVVKVRPFERKMLGRQEAFNVNQQKKVRLDPKSMKSKKEEEEDE